MNLKKIMKTTYRYTVFGLLSYLLVMVLAVGVLPLVSTSIINLSKITTTSSIFDVVFLVIIPTLFVMSIMVYGTINGIRCMYKKICLGKGEKNENM